jgi:hypothetical protein
MGKDEQLAIFLLWVDALEQSLSENTTFIIDTDMKPWHLLEAEGTGDVLSSEGSGASQ